MEKETVIQPENRRRPSLKQLPKSRIVTCTWFRALVWALPLFVAAALAPFNATAQEKAAAGAPEHKDLGAVGAKLANPLSELWSISMNFQMPTFYDGDVNTGDPKVGANMVFQPVLPMPLYGEGAGGWRLITRPVVPIIFSQPIPRGFDNFSNKGGIGDIQLPLLLSVPDQYAGKWILGAGPVGMFPTATTDALGNDQWAMGPAVVVGL